MSELLSLYKKHTGKISDRWSLYLTEYEHALAPLRDKDVRLLEIGIQNGGSLELWSQYFPRATKLVGCDVDPLCANLRYSDSRISVVVADASSDRGFQEIVAHSPVYDIVIDDGSHRSSHIVQSFARYFPLVKEGGVFVAEDLHCSYWQEFEGGLAYPLSSITFFKFMADVVNHEHWGVPLSNRALLADFEQAYGCEFRESDLRQVHSVEFANSMCIIRKKPEVANLLGPRHIVGEIEQVSTGAKRYDGTESHAADQTTNIWSGMTKVPSGMAGEYGPSGALHRIRSLETELVLAREQSWERVNNLKMRLEQLEFQEQGLQQMLAAKNAVLAELVATQNTYSARLGRLIARSGALLIPLGSRRRNLLKKVFRAGERALRGIDPASPAVSPPAHVPPTTGATVQRDANAIPEDFARWIAAFEPTEAELQAQREMSPAFQPEAPLFSIILPVYKVPTGVLRATIASLTAQTWQNWEACVAFADSVEVENFRVLQEYAAVDARIRVLALTENGGISRNSNAALAMARGQFVALLDHDDEFTPWALHDMASAIAQYPETDFFYSDKDSINADGTLRQHALFKPEWSPEMLYSVNYLTHLNVMRRSCLEQIGGWRPETDGAQDWDLFIRVAEVAREVRRVPGIGYHWRIIEGSTSTGLAAKPYAALGQLRTLQDWVRRQDLPATVSQDAESGFRVNWKIPDDARIDVILYGEASVDRLRSLVASVRAEYGGHLGTLCLVRAGPPLFGNDESVREVSCAGMSDLSAAMLRAAALGKAPVVTVVDTATREWITGSLLETSAWALLHPHIGFAAPLLLDTPNSVVEAGRVLGNGLRTQPLFHFTPLRHWGPLGGPLWYRNVSAASPVVLSIKRTVWSRLKACPGSWPDTCTALCKASTDAGLRGMVTPYARVFVPKPDSNSAGFYDPTFARDPYFHPYFGSVVPLTLKSHREAI